MKRTQLIALTIALAFSLTQAQANWPQFLGPNRDGVSNEKGLAKSWPKEGPKVLWTNEVGPGFGGASISDGQVFLLDRQDDELDVLRCLSLATGKKIWDYSYKFPGRLSHNGSRSVPTIDDDRIFAMGPFGHLYCVDRAKGELLWGVDLVDEFQARKPNWGFAQSPLMVKDLVIAAPMTEKVGLAALDKKTGKTVWQSPSVGKQSYASPMLSTIAGVEGILFFGSDQISFINPKNGDMIWNYTGYYCRNQIALPLVIKGDRIFMTGGYGAGSAMIQINLKNGKYDIEELFTLKGHGSHIQSALYYQDHIYVDFNNLICMDVNGRPKWKTNQAPSFGKGNFIAADDMIYILHGQTGELVLAQANPKEYKELARAKIFNPTGRSSEIWSPIALSDGRLVVRDQKEIKCLDVSIQ